MRKRRITCCGFGTIFTILFLSVFVSIAMAQKISNDEKPQSQVTDCETARLKFDERLIETKNLPGSFLIVILHRGKDEQKDVNKSRSTMLKKLSEIRGVKGIVIFAEGEDSPELGFVDLYAGGRLFRQIHYDKNIANFCSQKK